MLQVVVASAVANACVATAFMLGSSWRPGAATVAVATASDAAGLSGGSSGQPGVAR